MEAPFRPDETHGRPIKDTRNMLPTGFPGQLSLIAQQMNNGFGGGLLAQKDYLKQIYDPMKMGTNTIQQNQGDDGKTVGGDPTGGEFVMDPRMKKWASMFYNMPDGEARLRAMQEYFEKSGGFK